MWSFAGLTVGQALQMAHMLHLGSVLPLQDAQAAVTARSWAPKPTAVQWAVVSPQLAWHPPAETVSMASVAKRHISGRDAAILSLSLSAEAQNALLKSEPSCSRAWAAAAECYEDDGHAVLLPVRRRRGGTDKSARDSTGEQ